MTWTQALFRPAPYSSVNSAYPAPRQDMLKRDCVSCSELPAMVRAGCVRRITRQKWNFLTAFARAVGRHDPWSKLTSRTPPASKTRAASESCWLAKQRKEGSCIGVAPWWCRGQRDQSYYHVFVLATKVPAMEELNAHVAAGWNDLQRCWSLFLLFQASSKSRVVSASGCQYPPTFNLLTSPTHSLTPAGIQPSHVHLHAATTTTHEYNFARD